MISRLTGAAVCVLLLICSCKKEKDPVSPPATPAKGVKTTWQKTWGGTGNDISLALVKTADGGFVSTGYTDSGDGDLATPAKETDLVLVKYNADGVKQWQRSYGGPGYEEGRCIANTLDGGFIIGGRSGRVGNDVTGNKGGDDCWVVKVNSNGEMQWQKSYGGLRYEDLRAIAVCADGSYVAAGISESTDGDLSSGKGSYDAWILKLSNTGVIQWQKSIGSTGVDYASGLAINNDGTIVVAGVAAAGNGDVTTHKGGDDFWLVKLNADGNLLWQKTYGGTYNDFAYAITPVMDGGFLLAGYTQSDNGDVTTQKGNGDVWIVKTDADGSLQWQKSYGGTNHERGMAVALAPDGGFFIAGISDSNDGDLKNNYGQTDAWILKINNAGMLQWQHSNGGSSVDSYYSVLAMNSNSCIAGGSTFSQDHDLNNLSKGRRDAWIIRHSWE